jgi:hypothetical protein
MTKALQRTATKWCSLIPAASYDFALSTTSHTPVPSGPTPQTSVNLRGWILLPLLWEYLKRLNLLALGGATSPTEVPDDWPIRTAIDRLHDGLRVSVRPHALQAQNAAAEPNHARGTGPDSGNLVRLPGRLIALWRHLLLWGRPSAAPVLFIPRDGCQHSLDSQRCTVTREFDVVSESTRCAAGASGRGKGDGGVRLRLDPEKGGRASLRWSLRWGYTCRIRIGP